MQLPPFFHEARRLRLRDPLAEFLGAAEGGVLEYGYEDAVKLAGHSCPTVASAYIMTCRALDALYPDRLPERGGIAVSLREPANAGVNGVIGSIVTLLTGAAGEGGFQGIGGHFSRRDLLRFGGDQAHTLHFRRRDTGAAVTAEARLAAVPPDPEMRTLLGRCIEGTATPPEHRRFAALWQDRVRRILIDHAGNEEVFPVHPVA